MPRDEWEELQRRSGRLEGAETLIEDQRVEIQRALERVAQLEASAASAWTESRHFKEEVELLRARVAELESDKEKTAAEKAEISLDLDHSRWDFEAVQGRIEAMETTNLDLVEELGKKAGELDAAESKLMALERRYRRNGFVRHVASVIRHWIGGPFSPHSREVCRPKHDPE